MLYPAELQRRVLKNGVFSRFFTLRTTSYLHYYNSAGFQNPAFWDFKNPLHSNYEPDLEKIIWRVINIFLGGERSILLSYRDVYQIYSIFPLRRPSNYRPTVYINLSKLKNQAEFSILLSFSILFVTVRDIRCENRDKSKLNACFSLCFLAVLNCYYYI